MLLKSDLSKIKTLNWLR